MNLIINLAPTGMIPTKEMTTHVPVTAEEVIEDVHEAVEVGISMVHLHARDEQSGEPTYRAEVYDKIIAGIRRFSSDLVICVSLSGRNFGEFEKRIEPLTLEGKVKPDYTRCVSIVTRAAQKEMILPSLTAIIAPIMVGLLIGVEAVVGLLAGATVCGFVLAVMMANSGGVWDNAKKYIEEGNLEGKGSFAHRTQPKGSCSWMVLPVIELMIPYYHLSKLPLAVRIS